MYTFLIIIHIFINVIWGKNYIRKTEGIIFQLIRSTVSSYFELLKLNELFGWFSSVVFLYLEHNLMKPKPLVECIDWNNTQGVFCYRLIWDSEAK